MKAFGVTVLVFMLVVGLFVGGVVLAGVSALNREAGLKASINAHERAREASLDTMKKVIMQKAQLPAAAKEDLLALLPEVVEGRAGGSVFKSVQEKYPEFTMSLYQDLSRAIEAERHQFLREQKELFDVKREHDALLGSAFGGTVASIFGRRPVEVNVVSSTEAKEVIRTGLDDNSDLELTSKK